MTDQDITDESIIQIVQMVEAAELYAKTMGCTVAKAAEAMLRSMQALQRVQKTTGVNILEHLNAATKAVM